ncbi:MAG: polyprenyl synthetase family protein [Chloroflexota bacterium]|nr:polyprenyl synthetase family protein [Chloroflexota bacterium]
MIQDIAQRYFGALDSEMRHVVASAPAAPEFDLLLQYPLGWVDETGQPFNKPTGKRIRPMVLLLCTEAAGGDWQHALPAAAAVELLHNFTLLHDDIQDNSLMRHGRPTVWKVWGRANAINAGDALFTLAYVALHKLGASTPPEVVLKIWGVFNDTMLALTRGQHLDMRFERQKNVGVNEYISMIDGKTASLLGACAQIGALVGSHDAERAAHFRDFGINLGIAFQIHDDILGIWGDPKVTGKSAATDIVSKKKSLPVLYGLENSAALEQIYERPKFKRDDVREAVQVLDAIDARGFTTQLENDYYDRALAALERAQPQGAAGEQLRALAAWLFERAY